MSTSNPADTPPPATPRPGSCCGVGCFTGLVLFFILAVAFTGGGYWAIHRFQQTYFPTEPLEMPTRPGEVETIPTPEGEPLPEGAAPTAPPIYAQSERTSAVQERWDAFERAAKRGQKARIELTAADINTLLQSEPKLRGKGFVTIEDNVGRVRVSVPLEGIFMLGGRYFNGEATVESSPDGDPAKARISNITFGNQPMGEDVIDRRLFGWSSIRMLITDWVDDNNIATFRIENGRVIGETRGR